MSHVVQLQSSTLREESAMNIWHLTREWEHYHYDEVAEWVIVAETEQDARRMASDDPGDEGPGFWLDSRESTAVVVGTAVEDVPRVITRHFHAGRQGVLRAY